MHSKLEVAEVIHKRSFTVSDDSALYSKVDVHALLAPTCDFDKLDEENDAVTN